MTELELTRTPGDRHLYALVGIGTLRLEGLFSRKATAEAGGKTWRFTRGGFWQRVMQVVVRDFHSILMPASWAAHRVGVRWFRWRAEGVNDLRSWRRISLILLVLGVCVTALGVALASGGSKVPAKPLATRAATVSHVPRAKAASSSSALRARTAVTRSVSAGKDDNPAENTPANDSDNVQQGDQSSADNAQQGAQSGPNEESGAEDNPGSQGENESTPGDSTVDGVEQPAGADHQCPPDCVPGEK